MSPTARRRWKTSPRPSTPVVLVPGREPLVRPDPAQLADALGLVTTATGEHYDLVVIGAGPAGSGRCRLRRL